MTQDTVTVRDWWTLPDDDRWPTLPDYGVDWRYDALYAEMAEDRLWSCPAPPWLPDRLWGVWFRLPLLPRLWRKYLEPIRYRFAFWRWKRTFEGRYPTDADWAHD